ncbi:hypothetical protein PV458_20660 [Streptomyces sp. MN03-5084-2B]|jgi:hypothetical protein|nr:hypothetical protein [Streptomyces sp. MN03-5084-2B]
MSTSEIARPGGFLGGLNSRHHHRALAVFMVIVLAHWAEHLVQAVQIYGFGWPTSRARGVLGMPFPWLISQEWLHYGYALVMLVFLWALRRGFAGRSRQWWNLALGIQFWHHFEHLLLFVQAQSGWRLGGSKVPTSIIQLLVPRVELHLFYNTIVTIPMIVAVVLHRRASAAERELTGCVCGVPRGTALAAS